MIVKLEDNTIGTICTLNDVRVGAVTQVKKYDKNGKPLIVQGKVVEILKEDNYHG